MTHELDMECAGAARFLLDSVGSPVPPIDPFEVASEWGLMVCWTEGRSCLIDQTIFVEKHDSIERRRWDCAHELGHYIAWHVGLPHKDERVANGIASATLLPDRHIKGDLSRTAWDLAELVPLYQVSWEVMARRIPLVKSSVVTIVDNGEIWFRRRSRWLSGPGGPHPRRLEAWEERLAVQAAGGEEHIRPDNLVAAYSVPSPGWDRVVLVAGVEEWEKRTWGRLAAE